MYDPKCIQSSSPQLHFPSSFPSVTPVTPFYLCIVRISMSVLTLSASACATALLGTFPEVALFQGLRMGLDIIFFYFSWQLLFWNTVFSKKKSSCFTLFEAKLIISYFLLYLNVLVLFMWQEDLKQLLSFDLTLDISLNDNCSGWNLEEFQTTKVSHMNAGLQCHWLIQQQTHV